MGFVTEQEAFWAREFGEEYIARNQDDSFLAANVALFAKALGRARGLNSCIEFGANIGMNLRALRILFPLQEQHAIEINATAVGKLKQAIPTATVDHCSILDFKPTRTWDLVLIKGVLIHLNPNALPGVYDKLVESCGRYLIVCEYYNPTPIMIEYRGHKDRLFKRDFAGEIMDRHPRMKLLDYGFIYRRDPAFPQDDLTWFLMKKDAQA